MEQAAITRKPLGLNRRCRIVTLPNSLDIPRTTVHVVLFVYPQKELVKMFYDENIQTVLLDLPTTVKGFSKSNSDMTYTIVINARLTREQQEETYRHELEHITKDDFYSCDNADNIECERHY